MVPNKGSDDLLIEPTVTLFKYISKEMKNGLNMIVRYCINNFSQVFQKRLHGKFRMVVTDDERLQIF